MGVKLNCFILIALILLMPFSYADFSGNIGDYYNKIEECNKKDGWLNQEIKKCDDSGYYYITGRFKDYELDEGNEKCIWCYL